LVARKIEYRLSFSVIGLHSNKFFSRMAQSHISGFYYQ
jgi:hypothetical protein